MAEGTIYDEEHELFRATVRMFIEREVVPHFDKWEQAGRVDRDLFRRAGDAGLLGIAAPAEFGGGDIHDFRFHAILVEEFCRANVFGAGQPLIAHVDTAMPYFVSLCTPEQSARWMRGLCSGELIAGIAMTEPATGSDLAAISTRAVRDGDEYVINGSKQFISNGLNGDVFIVVCVTGDDAVPHRNFSLVVVEADTSGFSRGPKLEKIGQRSADTAALFFDDVRVPASNLLGEENKGFSYLMSRLAHERLAVACAAVAHAEAAFGWTLQYTKERTAFGQPIGSFQNSRFALATMRTELDIARVFVDHQILAYGSGTLTPEAAAEAKWWCAELNRRVLDQCLQLHGGYGYMEEYPIARAWRDGRVMSIYAGTTEIMKEIIGRRVLGL